MAQAEVAYTPQQTSMMIQAICRHGLDITPCAGRKFYECFTTTRGRLYFWFNTRDGSTHTVDAEVEK